MESPENEKVEVATQDDNPLGLEEAERRVLAAQIAVPPSNAGYLEIYRYADRVDGLLMVVSAVLAATAGAAMPLMMVVLGSLTGKFTDFTANPNAVKAFGDEVHRLVLYFVYIGIVGLVTTSLFVQGFTWTGQRMAKRIRTAYLDALLKQNIAFFDALGAGEIATRITADMNVVQDGVSQKVGLAISGLSGFVAAEVIAFVSCWRLALVMLALPLVITTWMMVIGGGMKKALTESVNTYAASASFAEEVISSMRNVAAYGSQKRLMKKYDASLVHAAQQDFKGKSMFGGFIGGLMGFMLSAFALATWAGSRFMANGDATVGQVVTVLMTSAIASVSFGQVAPHLQAFGSAGASANRIFAAIQRRPAIQSDSGEKLDHVVGHLEFRDIKFVYPSRQTQLVLEDFSLDIPAGETVAIVGPSGSGKSSLFSLLERFYSPLRGRIVLDGHDIQALDLRWLRSQMKIVSQESFLFNTTIFENIAYGLVGTIYDTSDEEKKVKLVEEAARIANAHDFILEFPKRYQTLAGENGSLLSGGQRQRIAIARAVVSNPRILLLDEATASLDTKSESMVQKGLDAASEGRTTIVIAHRLSTVKRADKIVVVEQGKIAEQGKHEDLMAQGGKYASLAAGQNLLKGSEGPQKHDSDSDVETAHDLALHKTASAPSTNAQTSTSPTSSRLTLVKFLWNLNKPEQGSLLLGLAGSIFSGLGYPLTAILFGNIVLALREPSLTLGQHGVPFWAGMQWLLAWIILFANLVQNVPFAHASSRLVSRARSVAFAAIVRQDMAFFARPENSPGALTAFLSLQANRLNGLSGAVLGAVLSSAFNVLAGFAIAVGFGWKLGLVAASTMPLIFTTGYLRYRVLADLERKNLRNTGASAIVSEAIRGIRTVATLGLEGLVSDRYRARLDAESRSGLARDAAMAWLYGVGQSMVILCSALIFWYGGSKLIASGEYSVRDFLVCYVATMYGAQSAGGIFSHAPDVAGAQEAAQRLKTLVETVPAIDAEEEGGDPADGMVGDISLQDVDFAYPGAQARHLVLKKVGLEARFGRFVALVGASGSGKSSVLNLLERLYDPREGSVLADGKNIRHYHLRGYRKQMALVEQDAVLYGGTVRENVISDVEATDEDVEKACRDANIWEFVQSLPDGLNTLVGPRGSQVSGGQKQRLAIARALLRNPKILLLDEATSALDSKSEAVVQKTLNAAAVGRTTIAVAHRLSSIAHADCIYVFEAGRVIEIGNHAELVAKRGRYWEYVGMQNLSK